MEDTQYNNRRSRSRKRRRKRKSCVFFKTFITVFAIFSLFLIGSRVLTPWFSGELTTEQMDGVGDNFSSIPETVQPDTSIFYLKADTESVSLEVAEDGSLSVSGNNVDGYIITEWRG